ncbi:hypothetical protein HDU96_008376 [Phlyctochytrium bullatum]|nr:hypothetical protein HDU96_008376 [Phlyctochytrium bullatum]
MASKFLLSCCTLLALLHAATASRSCKIEDIPACRPPRLSTTTAPYTARSTSSLAYPSALTSSTTSTTTSKTTSAKPQPTFPAGPVCAINNRTYPSMCALALVECRTPTIILLHPGPCKHDALEPSPPHASQALPATRTPSLSRLDNCLLAAVGQPGASCPPPSPAGEAPFPVCAGNGHTYHSSCEWEVARCMEPRLRPVSWGEACEAPDAAPRFVDQQPGQMWHGMHVAAPTPTPRSTTSSSTPPPRPTTSLPPARDRPASLQERCYALPCLHDPSRRRNPAQSGSGRPSRTTTPAYSPSTTPPPSSLLQPPPHPPQAPLPATPLSLLLHPPPPADDAGDPVGGPVCASDGKTYPTRCDLALASCLYLARMADEDAERRRGWQHRRLLTTTTTGTASGTASGTTSVTATASPTTATGPPASSRRRRPPPPSPAPSLVHWGACPTRGADATVAPTATPTPTPTASRRTGTKPTAPFGAARVYLDQEAERIDGQLVQVGPGMWEIRPWGRAEETPEMEEQGPTKTAAETVRVTATEATRTTSTTSATKFEPTKTWT